MLIAISNMLAQINFTWVGSAGEHVVSVVHNDVASAVSLRYREEEHVLNVGRHPDPSALADLPHWSNPDLLSYFRADNRFGLMLTLRGIRVRDVGMKPVSEKFLDHHDLTVVGLREVPDVSPPFSIAMSGFPRAGL